MANPDEHGSASPGHRPVDASLQRHLTLRCALLSERAYPYFQQLPLLSARVAPAELARHLVLAIDRMHLLLLLRGAARSGIDPVVARDRIVAHTLEARALWTALGNLYGRELPAHLSEYLDSFREAADLSRAGSELRDESLRGALNLILNYADELHAALGLGGRDPMTSWDTLPGSTRLSPRESEAALAKLGL